MNYKLLFFIKETIKKYSIQLLESHPLGYYIGLSIICRFDFLLPHESDYYGLETLMLNGFGRHKVILDLGANAGHSARAFLKLLPGWRIFSVEANHLHKLSLGKVKRLNNDLFNFTIAAADSISGNNIKLYTPYYHFFKLHSATSTILHEANEAFIKAYPRLQRSFKIFVSDSKTLKIDDLDLRFDIVKLDIQGGEYQAIIGMHKKIIELRPILLVEENMNSNEVYKHLESLGYSPWSFDARTKSFVSGIQGAAFGHKNIFFGFPEHTIFFKNQHN